MCRAMAKNIKKKTIIVYLLSIGKTVLLNLYFIVPFLDYYKNVYVNINVFASRHYVKYIQNAGAYLAQYFSFFSEFFGINHVDINRRMQLSPGLLLMMVLIVGIVFCIRHKRSKTILFYILFSVLMLFWLAIYFHMIFWQKNLD